MTRHVFAAACALALGCAIGVGAQTTAQTDATNANRDRDSSKDKSVTVVGCVQPQTGANDDEFVLMGASSAAGSATMGTSGSMPPHGTATGSATASTTGSTSGSTTGSSTSGTSGSAQSGSMPPSAGAAGTASAAMGSQTYELTGDREDELQNLVGKRVEIVGTVEETGDDDNRDPAGARPHTGATTGASGTSGTSATSGSATGSTGTATGGVTAGGTPEQTQSRSLARLKITSFREVGGDCSSVQR